MSRIPSNASAPGPSRLKISAPQPYQPPTKAFPPAGPSGAGSNGYGGAGAGAEGDRRPSGGSEGRAGPMRPARSIRRAPQPPGAGSPLTAMSYTDTPARMYADDAPSSSTSVNRLAPRPARRPSREHNDDDYVPLTPVERERSDTGSSAWDSERTQRAQMLDQQRQLAGHEDKLRNVVGAFAGVRGGTRQANGGGPMAGGEPKKKQKREGREQELFIGSGPEEFGDIDSVLRKIQREWPFVLDPDFAPSSLALSLLSSSSSQLSHPGLSAFLALQTSLASALQQAVQKHYQTYAASLPAHAALLDSMSRAQSMVREAKKQLRESRELLTGGAGGGGGAADPTSPATGGKRAEMGVLWAKERMLRDMLKTLDTIEKLKQVADKLETMIGDKRFLQAAIVLMRSIKLVDKEEMREIGALAELRAYLKGQQQTLADILVEELHNHLYLKSLYCDSRWKPYQAGQTEIHPSKQANANGAPTLRVSFVRDTDGKSGSASRLSTYLEQLSLQVSRNPMLDMADDDLASSAVIPTPTHRRGISASNPSASVGSMSGIMGSAAAAGSHGPNPEADSFAFMEMVLESLACLGKVAWAVEVIGQRVTGEIRTLVEGVVQEVQERNELRQLEKQTAQRPTSIIATPGRTSLGAESTRGTRARRTSVSTTSGPAAFDANETTRLSGLETAGGPAERETLLDFFWTLYSKLYAVVEGHRVVYEVVTRMAARLDYDTSSRSKGSQPYALPIGEVWKPIRTEVRSLLSAYLTDRGRGAASIRAPVASVNEVLRDGRAPRAPQPQRIVFKFSDTDKKAVVKGISAYEDELNRSLAMSVPGLALNPPNENSAASNFAIALTGDDAAVRQQRLLVVPNPFNVSVIYRPYIAFVSAVKDIIPAGFEDDMEPFGEFLNDFVVKVYLPQLEEKVTSLLQSAISGPDAFQVDVSSLKNASTLPVVKSAIRVFALVNSLCGMLATTPFNKEDYSRLIVGVIVRYYQRCSSYYRDLVLTYNAKAENPISLSSVWAQKEEMVACLDDLQKSDDVEGWRRQEMCSHETRLEIGLLDGKNVSMLDLMTSTAQFANLGYLAYSMRWFRDELQALIAVSDDMLSPSLERHKRESMYGLGQPCESRLVLSSAMAQRLDAILSTYSQLADMIEFTMRLELRTRAMAYLSASFAKGNYRTEAESAEPDPHILDWTSDLSECAAAVSASLPDDRGSFLFMGIGELVDQLLITCARAARYVTPQGVLKIKRNMLAVQQALCVVVDDPSRADLPRARTYWALYEMGPKAMLENLQTGKPPYTFDDYNHMLNLQCKVDPRAAARLSGQGPAHGLGGASSIASDRAAPDAERDAYNSYLIELHSLAMSMDDFQ